MKRTGPTNALLKSLIEQLRQKDAKLWKQVACELERATRKRREVNLSRLNRFAENGETIVVPGKVLSSGTLSKKIIVAAWNFSASAKDKIKAAGGKAISLEEAAKANPKGTGVKIIG